jgi:GH35 family endo-1,4-beta-xylanase
VRRRGGLLVGAMLLVSQVSAAQDRAGGLPLDDWRRRADERIERLRTADFDVELFAPDGRRLRRAEVRVTQTRSHFRFGTCVDGVADATHEDDRRYRAFILDHFNTLVCCSAMKWSANERVQGQPTYEVADGWVRFAEANGLDVHGHCVFWALDPFNPEWVRELSGARLKRAMKRRLDSVMSRYRGRLISWDVNNEMLDGRFYAGRLGPRIRRWMFQRARKRDPATPLFVNDRFMFRNLLRAALLSHQIDELIEAGADVGGIGLQHHECQSINLGDGEAEDSAMTPDAIWQILDALARHDLPLHLSEISAVAESDERRADVLEAIYRIGYAHPRVDAIILWGFWEKRIWLGSNAAIVNADWSLNAAGERISQLLLDEWRTNETVRTDAWGMATFRGFYGRYELVVVEDDGRALSGHCELIPGSTSATVRLQRD